jgi:hypothetical protein
MLASQFNHKTGNASASEDQGEVVPCAFFAPQWRLCGLKTAKNFVDCLQIQLFAFDAFALLTTGTVGGVLQNRTPTGKR